MQAGRVDKVGMGHAQFCRFPVHMFHKRFHRAVRCHSQGIDAVRTGGQGSAVQQVQHGWRIPGLKTRHRGIGFCQPGQHIQGNGDGFLRIKGFNGNDLGHHLGQRSRKDARIGIFLPENLAGIDILQKDAGAVDFRIFHGPDRHNTGQKEQQTEKNRENSLQFHDCIIHESSAGII